jgi:hypothetical protein
MINQRRMEAVHAIEVYIGEKGYVCIRQEDPLGDGETVAFLPQQVPAICQWLQECAAEILSRVGDSEPPPLRIGPAVISTNGVLRAELPPT